MQNLKLRASTYQILHVDVVLAFIALQCNSASIFHVLTYTTATSHVVDFSDDEQGAIGRWHALSYVVGVDGLIYL